MIKLEFFENKLTAKISGEIDHHSAADFRQQIDEFINKQKPEKIILDFNEVSFMDTSGIGFIMGRFKTRSKFYGYFGNRFYNGQI